MNVFNIYMSLGGTGLKLKKIYKVFLTFMTICFITFFNCFLVFARESGKGTVTDAKSSGTPTDAALPEINTRLYVKGMVLKEIPIGEKISLIDKVYFSGLESSTEYTLVGKLMIKNTEGSYKEYEKNGKCVVSKCTFKTGKYVDRDMGAAGEEWLEYDDIDIELSDTGFSYVNELTVEEKLYLGKNEDKNKEIAIKEGSEGNLYMASIVRMDKSKAADISIEKESDSGLITVVDSVSYVNLTPDMSYRLVGTLYDKETDSVIETSVGEKVFVAREADGDTSIEMEIDSGKYMNKDIMVVETLYNAEGNLIAKSNKKDSKSLTELLNERKRLNKATGTDAESDTEKKVATEEIAEKTIKNKRDKTDNKEKNNTVLQMIVYVTLILIFVAGFRIYRGRIGRKKT